MLLQASFNECVAATTAKRTGISGGILSRLRGLLSGPPTRPRISSSHWAAPRAMRHEQKQHRQSSTVVRARGGSDGDVFEVLRDVPLFHCPELDPTRSPLARDAPQGSAAPNSSAINTVLELLCVDCISFVFICGARFTSVGPFVSLLLLLLPRSGGPGRGPAPPPRGQAQGRSRGESPSPSSLFLIIIPLFIDVIPSAVLART